MNEEGGAGGGADDANPMAVSGKIAKLSLAPAPASRQLHGGAQRKGGTGRPTGEIVKRDVDAPDGLLEHRAVVIRCVDAADLRHAVPGRGRDLLEMLVGMLNVL